MASIVWNAGSGSWGDANDWNGGLPVLIDTVLIDTSGITVTIGAGVAAAAYTLNTSGSTLAMTGGTLDTVSQAVFGGEFVQTSGVYTVSGVGATFTDGIYTSGTVGSTPGGTITALAGAAINIAGGGILAGAITGTGSLDFTGGTTYINTGFTSSITSININALVGLDINFSTSSDLTVGSGSLDLFGHTLTVSGNTIVDGTLGNGVLKETGTLTLGSPAGLAYLDNGLIVDLVGKVIQSGTATYGTGDAGAMMDITKTGQYLLNGNVSIDDFSSIGSLVNSGTLAKIAGGKVSAIDVSMTSTGTINAETGTLLLDGLVNSLNGTVTGNGTLAIAGGQTTLGAKAALSVAGIDQESGILVLTKSLSYGGEWDMTGGILNFDKEKITLTLDHADFDGGLISGYGGTLMLGGLTEIGNNTVIGGPNTLTVLKNGVVDQTGNITLGQSSNPTVNIDSGAVWSIEGSSAIFGPYGLIDNLGTFIDPNGSGTAVVGDEFESTGTVTVNNGVLAFTSNTYLTGTVTGSGLLELEGGTVLESGLGVSVAELAVSSDVIVAENLAYANSFSETGFGNVDLHGGSTLTLTGAVSLDGGYLTDGGIMTASGPLTVENYTIENSTLAVSGAAEQTGAIELVGGTIMVDAGSTYTIDDNDSIGSVLGGVVTVAGNMVVDGLGQTTIDATVNTSGSLAVNGQELILNGELTGAVDLGGTLGGAISGGGSLLLNSGTFALASGLALTVEAFAIGQGAGINVASDLAYAGVFADGGAISLAGSQTTLTVSGPGSLSFGASVSGTGTLVMSGSTTLSGISVQTGATLALTGAVEQGPSNVSDAGTMTIAATSIYTLDANQSITGGGVLNVAGTLAATGDGVSLLQAGIVDAGVISANLGTLDVLSAVGGSGKFLIASGATLEFANASTIGTTSTIQFAGAASAGATLVLQNEPIFNGMLAGFTATGDAIELYDFTGTGTITLQDGGHQALVTDSNNDSITLSFTTVQTSSTLAIGMVNGHMAVIHS